MNKMGKIWQKIDKKSQFWIFFQYNHVLKPSQWIETSRFHMEMFWGFQKGIKHVSISNGCGVGSYNQGGLIFIFKTLYETYFVDFERDIITFYSKFLTLSFVDFDSFSLHFSLVCLFSKDFEWFFFCFATDGSLMWISEQIKT